MKKYSLLLLAILFTAFSCTKEELVPSDADRQFVSNAFQRTLFDSKTSQIVRTRGSRENIKAFAQMLIRDGSTLSDELLAHAQKRALTIPVELNSAYQQEVTTLLNTPNETFDQTYISMIIDSRKKTIQLYEQQIRKGNDNGLREWAAGKISKLQQELTTAEGLLKSL
jgi:putative membrane protein